MKKLVKRSDVMQETLEAYCSCSCSCYGTCSCSTGQTNNSAALFQARYRDRFKFCVNSKN